MTRNVLLTFNPGSSTIKLGLYVSGAARPRRIGRGTIDLRQVPLKLHITEGPQTADISLKAESTDDFEAVIEETLAWLSSHFGTRDFVAVGHRVVHGGDRFEGPALVTDEVLEAIEALKHLAPLHQPQSLRLIHAIRSLWPNVPQIASFDTAFHRSQSDLVRRFALPRGLFDQGVKRYGFHGLSYKYIAGELANQRLDIAKGRVVVAHLGSGASLCALEAGLSRATSMGFSTLDGIPMATRSGTLDPGVVLHMLKEGIVNVASLEDMLYHRSGLLGISGISADARVLASSAAPEAREALDIFALYIAREVAALATTIGGLDALVFTAGIGEHQPLLRDAACRHLAWLGISLDATANDANSTRIDAPASKAAVLVIPTDEEQVIADEAFAILHPDATLRVAAVQDGAAAAV